MSEASAPDSQGDETTAHESQPASGLTRAEVRSVHDLKSGSARVVHEVIRLQGDDELDRPLLSLFLSAFAAGLGITVSVLATAFLRVHLPDEPGTDLIAGFGYSIGFVLVIMGNLQLFTENTVTAVLPVATHPTFRNLGRLGRLWVVVLVGNLLGTLLIATLIAGQAIVSADQLAVVIDMSSHLAEHTALKTMLLGIPAGFLVASIAWLLPNSKGNEFWIVVAITYVIAIGGFSHVVAGSTEAWLMWITGHQTLGWAIGGFILPALAGNIVGGTGLFAVLAHGQVRGEIVSSAQ